MSLPKGVETRIIKALKRLKVSDEQAGRVSLAVEEAAQVLQNEIVPLSQAYRDLSGLYTWGERRDIHDQMDGILENRIGLKTYPELSSQIVPDESLALLVWGGSMTSTSGTSGREVLPAKLEVDVLGKTSTFYGFPVITGRAVSLAEVTGKGELIASKDSVKPRESYIYDSSPVIKLL